MPYNSRLTPSLFIYALNTSPKYNLARSKTMQPHTVSITSTLFRSSIPPLHTQDSLRQARIDQLAKEHGMREGLRTIKDFTLELEQIYGTNAVNVSKQRFFCLTRDHYILITQDIIETLAFIKKNGIQPCKKKDGTTISNTNISATPTHRAQSTKPTVADIDAAMRQPNLKYSDRCNTLSTHSKIQIPMPENRSPKTGHHTEKKANLFQHSVDKACHKYQLKTGLASTEDLMRCISNQYGTHVIHAIKKEFPSLAMAFTLLGSDVEKAMQFINKKKIPSLSIKAATMQHQKANAILGQGKQSRQYWTKPTPAEIDANTQSLSHLDDAQSDASFHFKSASQISPIQDMSIDESASNQARLNIAKVFGIDKKQEKTDLSTKIAQWIDRLETPYQR